MMDGDFTDYSGEGQEHFGKVFKAHVKLGNQKLYQEQKDEGKAGFVEQAVTRVVVAKHTDTTAPNRPGKRTRAVEKDGRTPRLLTKLEVEHAPNRRAKNAD